MESENIPQEIKSISSAHNIPVHEIDFKIIKVKTSFMLLKDDGWQNADKEILDKLNDPDFILNSSLKLKQIYKVDIFKIDHDNNEYLPPIVLGANKSLTKVIATIKKDIEVRYFSKLESLIIEAINKKKIKSGVLVGIHDENMYKEVKKIVSNIRVNGVIDEDNMFVVCQGIDPIAPVNDNFIYHYKKSLSKEDENGRVDYAKRGYVLAVANNDCIMEYIKPQLGVAGRNCQGKYIPVKEPETNHEIQITHTDNIIKKEDDLKVMYIASKNGYVTEDNPGSYDIKDEMEITEVSFKSTGSIETDMSSQVTINIKEADVFKDAIGPGMKVETHELNIEGNVASGAKIKAEILKIGGQTHKTSSIEAKKADITIHHGTIVGEEINIDRLEGGKVVGDIVNIKQAIGGEIIAKNVTIDELASNVQITASDCIEIKNLRGTNNKFLIDPTVTKEFNENIEKITEQIKELSLKLKHIPKTLEEKKMMIAKTRPTIKIVQEKIEELKNDGTKPPITLLSKMKEFQKIVNAYNSALKNYKNEKLILKNLREDLAQVQMKVFTAKIINHSPWKEYNEIKFKLISPAIEKVYNTKDHEIIREITLKETSEGEYRVEKSTEYSK